jgi:hypothetical protein
MSVVNVVTLGTLTAIRPQHQSLWILCIVRRMKRLTSERAEIGLQVIAHNLTGVDIFETKKRAVTYSVDGETPTVSGRKFQALFLSLHKREGHPPVQTLIVPAGEYQSGKKLRMVSTDSTYAVSFGRLLEQHPDWIWATVESLEVAAANRSATGGS